jgi:hypothetical protein
MVQWFWLDGSMVHCEVNFGFIVGEFLKVLTMIHIKKPSGS